jgi:hypothetical protein
MPRPIWWIRESLEAASPMVAIIATILVCALLVNFLRRIEGRDLV